MQRDDIFDAIHIETVKSTKKEKKLFLSVISLSKSNESIYRITKLMLGLHLASFDARLSDCNVADLLLNNFFLIFNNKTGH